jgi:hypothetical protein
MNRRHTTTLFASALASLFLLHAGPVAGQHDDGDWLRGCERQAERSDRATFCEVRPVTVPLVAGALAVDAGHNGGVAVRGGAANGGAGGAQVSARIQAQAQSDQRAREIAREIRVHASDGLVRSVGPATSSGESWSVSYAVTVPRQADLELTAVNGPIAIHDVAGRIRAETRNGPLALDRLAGDVYARTRNGPVTVTLAGARWDGAGIDAETTNGPINLALPEGFSAELETGTINGPLALGFPLTVTLSGRRTGRLATTLGEGGPTVRVVTTNGPATLSRP